MVIRVLCNQKCVFKQTEWPPSGGRADYSAYHACFLWIVVDIKFLIFSQTPEITDISKIQRKFSAPASPQENLLRDISNLR